MHDPERRHGDPPWAGDPTARPPGFEPFPPEAVETSVPQRFRAVARRFGARPAVIDRGDTLTYADVVDQVDGIAGELIERVTDGPAQVVGLLFGHGSAEVVAFLAVLSAGQVVVVLDPEASTEVNRAILADARPIALIHDDRHAAGAQEVAGGVPRFRLGDLMPASTAVDRSPARPPVQIEPGSVAMLAYTSGTTGAPKAAVVSHRALLHLVRGATDALAISPTDRLPMLFPLSLAVAAYPMLLPLLGGAALCVFDLRAEGLARFPEWLVDQKVSVMYFSPTIARFIGGGPAIGEQGSMRLVVLGGERVDDDAVEIVRRRFGSSVLVANGYGSTETGVLTFYFTDPDQPHGTGGVPAGRPIPGMELEILGPDARPVGASEVGDLHVRSRYLFDGYWRRPDATDQVLVRDGDVVVYRTGDLGRVDASGCLELVGRSDTEVKVRGHRVVPGEVEQALLALDEVSDAVVEARPDPLGAHSLVAWVVPATRGDPASAFDVRAALARSVSAALVPRDIEILEALPALPNGKLDRQALPEPGTNRPLPRTTLVAPRDELERALVRIWEQVLAVRPIGVADDFFDLGGTSLDAARMLVVLEEEGWPYVPMATLIDRRTVADLAVVLREDEHANLDRRSVVEVQGGDPGLPPLFFVHDLYGTAWVLQPLAPLLGPDQPLFGFESPLLRGPASPFRDLDAMATHYVDEVRSVQPEGPYHLAGYSFGGVLAFEMARQLVEAGHTVAFLGVVDVGPGYRGRHFDPKRVLDKPPMWLAGPLEAETSWRDRVWFYRDFVRRDPRGAALHVAMITGLDRWTDPVQFRLDLRRTGEIHPRRRTWYAWRTHWELARRYRWEGRRYPGDLTLFWAEETAAADSTMGWGAVVDGDLDIVRIDAAHETMMQAGTVERLAEPLRAALSASRQRSASVPRSDHR